MAQKVLSKRFTAVVLAAGEGKRMRSSLPKVLHEIKGKPLVYYVIRELLSLKKYVADIVVVTGYEGAQVRDYVQSAFAGKNIRFVRQAKRLGTAHAVKQAMPLVRQDNVLILCADAPLIQAKTLTRFIEEYSRAKYVCSLISSRLDEDTNLGEVLRDSCGKIKAICEKVDGSRGGWQEINSGIYAFSREVLDPVLRKIKPNPKKQEYFLTDAIEILYNSDAAIGSCCLDSCEEALGINTFQELAQAEKIMQKRIINSLIEQGVRIIDPDTTFIEDGVKVGINTVIFPFTCIEKDVIIGAACQLGPFIRIRGGSRVRNKAVLGNFVEVNRSVVGEDARMKHFGYLGDTSVGKEANIGAGTVVANYDGKNKHKTVIGDQAFIGSDSILVAPLRIGKGAATGAGSVVTHDVKPSTVVVGVPARVFKKRKG